MAVSKFSDKLREMVDQARGIESRFKQTADTCKLNWTDQRQNEFYMKYTNKQVDTLAELHRELNALYYEVSRMESSLNRYR